MRLTGTLLAAFVLLMLAPTLAHAEPSGKEVCKTELDSEKADCRTEGMACKEAVKAQHEACVAEAAIEEDLLGCTMDRQIGISDCGADYEACTAAAKYNFGLCLENVGEDPTKQCTDDCDGRLVVDQVKCDVEFNRIDSCVDEDCVGTEDECTDPVCKEKVKTLLTECLDHATEQHARCIESCGRDDPDLCPCFGQPNGPLDVADAISAANAWRSTNPTPDTTTQCNTTNPGEYSARQLGFPTADVYLFSGRTTSCAFQVNDGNSLTLDTNILRFPLSGEEGRQCVAAFLEILANDPLDVCL